MIKTVPMIVTIFFFALSVGFASGFESLSAEKTAADFGAETVLIVHYHRFDGNYSGWNLWIWPYRPESLAGAAYQFTGTDGYGPYAVVKFDEKYASLGFIVRLDDWKAKDVAEDRHAAVPPSGVAEIWLVQGRKEWTSDLSKIDISPRSVGTFLNSLTTVDAALTNPIDTRQWATNVKVTVGGEEWPVKHVKPAIAGDLSKTSDIEITLDRPLSTYDVSKPIRLDIRGFAPATVYVYKALNDPRFYYSGRLGPVYTPKETTFRVWSPVSESATLLLYKKAGDAVPYASHPMNRDSKGVWSTGVGGDLNGFYYLYEFRSYGVTRTTPDINCRAADMNNEKSMVVDLSRTDPRNWKEDVSPKISNQTDAVIYELDVRDYTSNENSGVPSEYRGKYLGLTVRGTAYDGIPTALDHLMALGVTDVHLMPIQDYRNVPFDQYNWGYITYLFNVPEAQYSTDPSSPSATIRQVKEMVGAIHKAGIGVVMDVVYNHTAGTGESSPFDQTVPYYYYRIDSKGAYLDESGVGNTFASENDMARKYIIDSAEYWVRQYHVNGFRFDLMGIMDRQTVKDLTERLRAIDPDMIIYGEPWGGWDVMPLFGKGDQKGMHIAVFNDDFRDAVIGRVFDLDAKGFLEGNNSKNLLIQRGVVGETDYSQTVSGFASRPDETVNYVTSHDNYTLWDKINGAEKDWPAGMKKAAQKLANAIILTSQGVPFMTEGVEFARTKGGNGNSYNAGDSVNGIDWSRLSEFEDVNGYYEGLVKMRLAHPAFRMKTAGQIREHITFFPKQFRQVTKYLRQPLPVVAYEITGNANGDGWRNIVVVYNGSADEVSVDLPKGTWNLVADGNQIDLNGIKSLSEKVFVSPVSMFVLYQK